MRRLFAFLLAALVLCGFGLSSDNGTVIAYNLDYSGIVEYNRPGTPLACWDFEAAVGANYDDDCSGVPYTMQVMGAPVQHDDATWPETLTGAQGQAWHLNGVNTYLRRLNDGTFNPAGDFSVQCVMTTHDVTATGTLAGKYNTVGNQRGWVLQQETNDVRAYVSSDGTGVSLSSVFSPNCLEENRPTFITFAYDFITDGTSDGFLYVDHVAMTSNLNMVGPAHASTTYFTLGSRGNGTNVLDGDLHACTVYDGIVLTEADHDDAFSRWQGRSSTAGDSARVSVVNAAPPSITMAPPASGTEPYIINQTANSMYVGSPVAGSGGLLSPTAITNLCFRRSLETWAAGAPTGWTETSGGGASDATQNTTSMAHGGSSAQMVCDGVNTLTLDSGCTALVGSQEHQLTAELITTAGVGNFSLQIIECTDGACAVGCAVTNTVYGPGDPGANWIHAGGEFTTAAGTNSGRVRLLIDTNAATVLADAVQMIDYDTAVSAFCPGDTDAAAVCNTSVNSISSPFEGNGVAYAEGTWRAPWDGVDQANWPTYFVDGSTAGNNYLRLAHNAASDEPYIELRDNAGATRTIGPNLLNWTADTDYTIMFWASGEDEMGIYWNAGWRNGEAGAGTGMRSANQATSYVGNNQATGYGVWTRALIFFRRIKQY